VKPLIEWEVPRGVTVHASKGGQWYAKYEADAVIRELEPAAKWFGEVMAMIHGDGGRYLAEHGPEKAANDAVAKFRELEAERDALVVTLNSPQLRRVLDYVLNHAGKGVNARLQLDADWIDSRVPAYRSKSRDE